MSAKKCCLPILLILTVLCCLLTGCGEKDGYVFEKTEGGVMITDYTGEEKNIIIPETLGGKTVVAIGEAAFEAKLIETVKIPETVTLMEKYAFRRCGYLKSVTIEGRIKSLPDGAFNYCTSLAEITLPDTLEVIHENAFGKSGLTKITLPDSVKIISDYAFYECHSLTEFSGGKGLENIGNNTFGNCVHLASVKLEEGLKTVGEYAFSGCVSLTDINIPTTLNKLSAGVLSGLQFTEYTVPDGIESVETYAFAGCKKLEKIYIPENVKTIMADAFKDIKGLVICGVRDSQAEIYADTYGYKFEEHVFG